MEFLGNVICLAGGIFRQNVYEGVFIRFDEKVFDSIRIPPPKNV